MPARRHDAMHRTGRSVVTGIILLAVVFGTSGAGCDSAARATFRDTATGAFGSGIKTILNGVVDGAVAAIEEANRNSDNDASGGDDAAG